MAIDKTKMIDEERRRFCLETALTLNIHSRSPKEFGPADVLLAAEEFDKYVLRGALPINKEAPKSTSEIKP